MMQFYKVMYPIFARLGVKLITRNVGQGGLGTIQAGMGSGSIYGNEIDVLLWDSGTSKQGKHELSPLSPFLNNKNSYVLVHIQLHL